MCEKMLSATFDNKLTYEKKVRFFLKKDSRNIYTLARATRYMDLSKRQILPNTFFKSYFNYCPLIWLCCSRTKMEKEAVFTKDVYA